MILNGGDDSPLATAPFAPARPTVTVIVIKLVGFDEVGSVEKSTLLETEVDKRRLHAGQNCLDSAVIDVSYCALQFWAVN